MNLNNKKFIATQNKNGIFFKETIFHYMQRGTTIIGHYSGGSINSGYLIGKQTQNSIIEVIFQSITIHGDLKTVKSAGKVSKAEDGKLRIEFDWLWMDGNLSGGQSTYIEID